MGQVRVAIFIAGCNKPTFTEIEDSSESMQALVGGSIEAVPMENYTESGIGEGLMLVCNEEGKVENLPVTRRVPGDVILGSFFVMRLKEGENVDLTRDDERLLSQWRFGVTWGSFQ